MSSSGKPFTTVTFEDGSFAVVRADPRKPRLLEVIALLLDASRARSYAEMENSRSGVQAPREHRPSTRFCDKQELFCRPHLRPTEGRRAPLQFIVRCTNL